MRAFRARLVTRGFLHFYSTEYLKTTAVSSYLHNWALMFAINDVKANPAKDHLENLAGVNFYATPATPLEVDRRSYLRNPVPEDTGAGRMGLMLIEYFLPGSQFEFYILSRDGLDPPQLIFYGKKRAECKLELEKELPLTLLESISVRPPHLVNPLDYESIQEVAYAKKIPMQPSPLYYLEAQFQNVLVVPRDQATFPYEDNA